MRMYCVCLRVITHASVHKVEQDNEAFTGIYALTFFSALTVSLCGNAPDGIKLPVDLGSDAHLAGRVEEP